MKNPKHWLLSLPKRLLLAGALTALLVGVVVAGAARHAFAQAAPTTSIFTFSFVGFEFYNPCNGELMLVTSG